MSLQIQTPSPREERPMTMVGAYPAPEPPRHTRTRSYGAQSVRPDRVERTALSRHGSMAGTARPELVTTPRATSVHYPDTAVPGAVSDAHLSRKSIYDRDPSDSLSTAVSTRNFVFLNPMFLLCGDAHNSFIHLVDPCPGPAQRALA